MKTAVYSGTRNIYHDILTSAKSLIANSDIDQVYILAEDAVVEGEKYPEEMITILDMHDQTYFEPGGPNMKSSYSYMSLLRAALPLIFEDQDLMLSLDHDVIVRKDCSNIWKLDVTECYFAASMEAHRSKNGLIYCNTGVCLRNMAFDREMGFSKEVVRTLNRQPLTWVDQDALCYMAQGRIAEMPSTYNANNWTFPCYDPIIKHFAGKAASEWRSYGDVIKWAQMPWTTVMKHHEKIKKARQ